IAVNRPHSLTFSAAKCKSISPPCPRRSSTSRLAGCARLAVTSATRSEALPDVPTIGDFLPDYEVTTWFGIAAPSKPPVELIMKLNNEINAALADPKIRAQRADLGGTALLTGSPADFGRYIAYDVEKWAKVVKFSGANTKSH